MTETERWQREQFPDRDLLFTLLNLRRIAMRLYLVAEPHEGMTPQRSNSLSSPAHKLAMAKWHKERAKQRVREQSVR